MVKKLAAVCLAASALAACGSGKHVQLSAAQIKELRADKADAQRLKGIDTKQLQSLTAQVCSSSYKAGGDFHDVTKKAGIDNPGPFLLRATVDIQKAACPDQLKRIRQEEARNNTTTTTAKPKKKG